MPSTAELQASTYKRGQKVKVVVDLPGVPAGTAGKISLANGFAWTRYWVRFANGVVIRFCFKDHLSFGFGTASSREAFYLAGIMHKPGFKRGTKRRLW